MEREFDCGKVTVRGTCSTHGEADPDFVGSRAMAGAGKAGGDEVRVSRPVMAMEPIGHGSGVA
jgi:hypothetical protein